MQKRWWMVALGLLVVALVVIPHAAFAGGTPTPSPTPDIGNFVDYSKHATAGKQEIAYAVGYFGGIIISIVVGLVGLDLLVKWLIRAPKQS